MKEYRYFICDQKKELFLGSNARFQKGILGATRFFSEEYAKNQIEKIKHYIDKELVVIKMEI